MAVSAAFGGLEHAFVCDNDKGPMRLLEMRLPGVMNLEDITTVDWGSLPHVNVLAGGSPCTDLSVAGAKEGMFEGTRSGLWFSMLKGIRALKPDFVVWENVSGALSALASSDTSWQDDQEDSREDSEKPAHEEKRTLRALGRVLGDLNEAGYDAVWESLLAKEVGACHNRLRVFVLAYRRDQGVDAVPKIDPTIIPWSFTQLVCPQLPRTLPEGEPKVLARWDTQKDCWMREGTPARRRKIGLLEHWGVFSEAFPKRGMSVGGKLYLLPATKDETDVKDNPGLPTPRAVDYAALPGAPAANSHVEKGMGSLAEVIGAIGLPTPVASDYKKGSERIWGKRCPNLAEQLCDLYGPGLPTPDAYAGRRGGASSGRDRKDGGHSLSLQDALYDLLPHLPTPSATDGDCRGTLSPEKRLAGGHQVRLGDALLGSVVPLPPRVQERPGGFQFAQFEARVRLHEESAGRLAPFPLVPTRTGGWKLDPIFQEWMMMLPQGWLTDPELWEKTPEMVEAVRLGERSPAGRRQALMMGGNGVVPLQGFLGLLRCFALARGFISNSGSEN